MPLSLALAFAFGLGLLAFGWRTDHLRTGGWLALGVVGQAAALHLIEAGPVVGYQHYVRPDQLTGFRVLSLAVVGLQTALVVAGLAARRRELVAFLSAHFRWWQLAATALAIFLIGAAPSLDIGAYAVEIVVAFVIATVNLGNVCLVALSVPASALERFGQFQTRWLGADPRDGGSAGAADSVPAGPRIDRFVLAAALWVVLISSAMAVFAYERHPHVPDEVVYLYHARYFAAGSLDLPAPPVRDGFDVDLMTYEDDRWYSPVPPGWPAVLAVGSRIGAPWLVNPLLAGVAVLLAYLLTWQLAGRRTARLCALLFCVSPWFLFMGMSFLTHMASLVAALAAACCVAWVRAGSSPGWAVLAGVFLAAVGLIRPLEAVVVGLLLGLWILPARAFGRRLVPAILFGAAALAVSIINLPYNRHLTDSYSTFPLMEYTDRMYGPGTNALGFGPERGLGWSGLDPFPGHSPVDAVLNTDLNTFALNVELFGWSAGSLFLLTLFLFTGRMRRTDYLMLGAVATVVGIHVFYWFSGGPDFGPRYWYLIIFPCVLLTARAVQHLGIATEASSRLLIVVLALSISSVATFLPWRATDKYFGYRGMRPGVRELVRNEQLEGSLILIRGRRHPDYASAVIYNPLDLQTGETIYAWERNADVRARLLDAYPDRRAYVFEGPSIAGGRYRLVEGPIETGER